jgi:purine-binding chemotaxis protein CheW
VNLASQLVVFALDGQQYALELSAVERTVRMVEITPLPHAPAIVAGIINVQGQIIPVLNIRKRFSLPERDARVDDQLLIARTKRRTVALAVDTVSGLINRPDGETTRHEEIVPGIEYVAGVVKLADGMAFIHDLDDFLSLEEEDALSAALEREEAGDSQSK